MAREVVMGKPGPPIPTGQMVYRVTLPVAKLKGIPELEELINVPRNNHWIGPHGTILSYLLEGVNETLINFVFTWVILPGFTEHMLICCSCDVNMPDGVNQKIGDNADVRASFKDWDARFETIYISLVAR
jgi:salicylate hydroxylase